MYKILEEGDDPPNSNTRACSEDKWSSSIDSCSTCEPEGSSFDYELLGKSGEIFQKSGERQGASSESGRLHLTLVILNNYYLFILSFNFSCRPLFRCYNNVKFLWVCNFHRVLYEHFSLWPFLLKDLYVFPCLFYPCNPYFL